MPSPLERGLEWLIAEQHEDGGWHSETYGALRGGAAITSLALYAASHLPDKMRTPHARAFERGYAFLLPGLKKQGTIACPDGSLDFPVYAAALVLTAADKLGLERSEKERSQLAQYLIESQLGEAREFQPGNKHFGGWDLMGNSKVLKLTSDTNVSLAVYALEALHGQRTPAADRVRERARAWLECCQNLAGDGGFKFSPDGPSLNNKAGWSDDKETMARSYGTATADGLRALIHAGVEATDRRATAALKWLADHPGLLQVPGFEELPEDNDWDQGLLFYYYASLSKALAWFSMREAKDRREALYERVVKLQRKDGRWQNDSARMREDDPLIATCLALAALGELARAA